MTDYEQMLEEFRTLPPDDQAMVCEYIAFLKWRAGQGAARPAASGLVAGGERAWHYGLVENFREATFKSSENRPGMEVKVAEAIVGGERRPSLWAHPPVSGESQIEFSIPVPAGLRDLTLQFAIGIRDGVPANAEQLVAFRVRVAGWQVWSHAAYPRQWQPITIALPMQAGDVLRLVLATDSLGDHKYAWAVWGEPVLKGLETAS